MIIDAVSHFGQLSTHQTHLQPVGAIDRDLVTGLHNANGFGKILDSVVQTSQENNDVAPCFAQIDIDRFMEINSEFGFEIGEAVLVGLVGRLVENLRAIDHIGRLARDKFAICFPSTSLRNAANLAESMRDAVAGRPFNTLAGRIKVSVTIGVSTIKRTGYSANDVFLQGSLAMHLAKNSGRNRVFIDHTVAWP